MRGSSKLLLSLLALYAVGGAATPHIAHSASDVAAVSLLLAFPAAVALFSWCKLDAKERHIVAPAAAPLLVGGLALIGVPYYYLKTLPLRNALVAIGKTTVFFIVLNLVNSVASHLSAKWAV